MKRILFTAAGALMLFAASAQAQQAVTVTGTDLFAGPGEDYPPVVELGGGYPLQVYGCVGGYTWCDVSYQEFRGWIDGRDLQFPYQEEEVPVDLYGPELGLPIISFSIGSYWGSYYHDRPFYRDYPRWENHAPPPRYWDGPRRDWNSEQRERYQHFEQVRRDGGHDPRNFDHRDDHFDHHDGDNHAREQQAHEQQDQQRRQQDQQHDQRQQQLNQAFQQKDQQRQQQDLEREKSRERQEELRGRQDQQRQQQQQQRQQQDQQRQQQQQQRQQQDQQRQQQQQQRQQQDQQRQQQQQQRQQQDQQRQQQQQQQHQDHRGDDHHH